MSSSSAFVVSLFLSAATLLDLESDPVFRANLDEKMLLADYLGAVENGHDFRQLPGSTGVGTEGGSQDHAAILYSRTAHVIQYAYRPLRQLSAVRLPSGVTFVIGSSGVRANKSGHALEDYNRAVFRADRALEVWNRSRGSDFHSLGQATRYGFSIDEFRSTLEREEPHDPDHLVTRIEQFVTESGHIVPEAVQALEENDLDKFGRLTALSQQLAETCLENQIDETKYLVSSAIDLGAHAASAFGAGFGGAVWALVPSNSAAEFRLGWEATYREKNPERAEAAQFFSDNTGPGAFVLGSALLGEPSS